VISRYPSSRIPEKERLAKLLLKAVRTLPKREQDQLLATLFLFLLNDPPPVLARDPKAPYLLKEGLELTEPGQFVMLPVRLPPELHERLRGWSTEQGFSMASIVRGLVERFLEQQERIGGASGPKQPNGTTAKPQRRSSKTRSKRTTARG
jgi:hypothetical protein